MKNHVEKVEISFRARIEKKLASLERIPVARRDDENERDLEEARNFLAQDSIWQPSQSQPVAFGPLHCIRYEHCSARGFIYQDTWYVVGGRFTEDQKKLLVLEYADKERQYFEKLQVKLTSPTAIEASRLRERIPEAVRIAVWRRDKGRCADCGSRAQIEYDHIIPLDKGGSNTVRNVELLCHACNAKKGNRIDEVPFFLSPQ